jgi:hypothetical protein
MGKSRLFYAFAAALVCFLFVPSVFADTATMTLDGQSAWSNQPSLGGNYVGPYPGTVNGQSALLVCDDYVDESTPGESWTALVTPLDSSNLSSTKWDSASLYDEAAYLVQEMFQPGNSKQIGDLQYAIWDLFESGANPLSGLSQNDVTNVDNWLTAAESAQNLAQVNLSDFTIYTPTCGASPCQNPPQEFITYRTPEPPFVLSLLADLLLFGGAAVVLRRRGVLFART